MTAASSARMGTADGDGDPSSPGRLRSALLILNPRAGRRERDLDGVLSVASELGWRLNVVETERRGHATQLAAEAAARREQIVLIGGGDGTMNEVIQALAGTETAVGTIPFGTMNVWARELGLSLDPAEATRQLLQGQIRRIDLGRINDRYFLLMAGIGFDAEAVHALGDTSVGRFKALTFFLTGALAAIRTSGQRVRIRADQETFDTNAALVTVGNTRLWAGAVQITHRAAAADGLLDVCIFPGRSLLTKLRYLALVLIGRHDHDPDVIYRQVRELHVAARPPIPAQVDGEPFGSTPVHVSVVPGSLLVLVGAGNARTLRDAPRVESILPL